VLKKFSEIFIFFLKELLWANFPKKQINLAL